MAGRRVALKAIDWVAFAERIPPNQKSMFNALKTRSDAISAKLVKHHIKALERHDHHRPFNMGIWEVFEVKKKKKEEAAD